MNQYGSALRTYLAPNLIETTLPLPPASLSLTNSYCVNQLLQSGNIKTTLPSSGLADWNIQSNILIRRVGLFSNFADGFVFLSPSMRPNITLSAYVYSVGTAMPGTVSITAGTKNLVGVATSFATPGPGLLVVGKYYYIKGHIYQVSSITSNTQATLTQYLSLTGDGTVAGQGIFNVTTGSSFIIDTLPAIGVLNYMHECERFIPAGVISLNLPAYGGIFVLANLALPATWTLGTVGIDTGWSGAAVTFDAQVDVEITMA